jgi:hypothetical protein
MKTSLKRLFPTFLLIACLSVAGTINLRKALSDDSDFARYNDTFETLNEDIWDRAQYTRNEEQLKNFKLGNLEIVDNRLQITTRTGGFSKAGLSSRYVIRGDFDVQIDCHIKFNTSLSMDQLANFAVANVAESFKASQVVMISLGKNSNRRLPVLAFLHIKNQKRASFNHRDTGDFHGTVRLAREGKKVTGSYKREGSSRWYTLGSSSSFTREDVIVGFTVQNFQMRCKEIKAAGSVAATFDNFRINHAGEVIEDEI